MLKEITPVILTFNEAANIGRTLACLHWAPRVVVLDSGSSDQTESIARAYANVEWQVRAFDNHAAQCNFVLDQLRGSAPWVLFIDADYQMPESSAAEIALLTPGSEVSGFEVQFTYCVDGRPLSGALYPKRTVLFRPERGVFVQEGHTQRLKLDGLIRPLQERFLHDDRKQVARFFANQRKYAVLEAQWLWSRSYAQLRWSDRVRHLLIVAPWLVPAVALFWRGGLLDGRRGLRYAAERAVAESLVSLELLKLMLSGSRTQ